MQINPNIFRGYDIRGIVNEDLNPAVAEAVGGAFGAFLKRRGIERAVVGYDCRATSPEYGEKIIQGLSWAGVDVINIGLNLIGTFYWAQYHLDCRGGVFVTASHNPAEYNGFKLAVDFSETLVSDDIQSLRQMIESDDFVEGKKKGTIRELNIKESYLQDLLKRVVVQKKFKVVVDAGFATAGIVMPELLRRAGCEVVEVNCSVDSSFPLGTPDPIDINVANRLSVEVVKNKADIGFSYDADGDRIGVVDDKGGIIWNDILVAVFAVDALRQHPGGIIMYNTLCSKVVEDTILQHKGKPFMWRTGHSFLKKKNQEIKAVFIGELSGHFFFSADFYNHDDGAYSTLRLLSYLSKSKKSLSEIVGELVQYISSPEIKIYCPEDKKTDLIKKIIPKLKGDFPDGRIIDDERAGDGVRVDLGDGMFVIRFSQNAPYLTIKFESKTQKNYNRFKNYLRELLVSFDEIDWDSAINVNTKFLE